jgi:energy-coupling factor transport system ATP-binding protein
MSYAMAEIVRLGHTYMAGTPHARTALHEISLTLQEGETAALVGPTGSGKSTLLQHINGIYTPRRGSVRVLGRDLGDPHTDLVALRREVGLVLQNPEHQVFERFVGDDIAFGPRAAGIRGADLARRVRWAMEQVGLSYDKFRDRPTFALSGGERRKVGLAGVIALKPRLLLLDEPTAGLDPEAHDELMRRLAALRSQGLTLVVATHAMDDVAALADRVVVLDAGRLVLDGPVREVFGKLDELRELGLDIPGAARVVRELADRGHQVRTNVLSLDEAEQAILEVMGDSR